MTDATNPSTEPAASKTAIRYPNLSGALVTVESHREERAWGPRLIFSAQCTACLEAYQGGDLTPHITRPRSWAAEHSATCRALPQPGTDRQ